jgi:hypothetical protein
MLYLLNLYATTKIPSFKRPLLRSFSFSGYISEHQPKKIPSRTWRECIKKVWEVNPLECTNCGAEMKIVSFIKDAPAIEKILKHLKLWRAENPGKPPPEDIYEDMVEYLP